MFIATLLAIAKHWKQSMCSSTDEHIKCGVYIYTMDYSVLNRNEVVIHTITWMNCENIVLREISQSQKDKGHIDSTSMKYLELINSYRQTVV